MSFNIPNAKRELGGKGNTTSITTSQRSSCVVVIYRWENPNIVKTAFLDAKAEAQTFLKGTNPTNGNLKEANRLVIKNDVVRCSITKNKNASAGQFQITLKRGKQVKGQIVQNEDINYLDLINSGDWVMIYMKKTGVIKEFSTNFDSGLKCVGIVDNIRYVEVDDEQTGKPRLEYVITGQDFGKVFDMDVFFNPLLNKEQASAVLGAKFLLDSKDSLKGNDQPKAAISPDKAVKELTRFYLGGKGLNALTVSHEPWYVPKSLAVNFGAKFKARSAVAFIDLLNLDKIGLQKYSFNKFNRVEELPGGTIFRSLPSEGTIWSILEFAKNSIANEMYTELVRDANGELKPSLVLRQIPYSNKSGHETSVFTNVKDEVASSKKTFLVDLPQLRINSSDIKQKNVGKSDFERVNHLLVVPRLDDVAGLDFAYTSAANIPSIQRYGMKSYKAQTSFILGNIGNPQKTCSFFLHLLMDWFFLAHQFYNGTIIIDGPDENVELGTNLYIQDINQLYHIEGYNHEYEVVTDGKTRYVTSLTVSRGQVLKNARAEFIGLRNAEPTTITTSVLEGIR